MGKRPRLGLYYENEDIKRRLIIAAARRGISTTAYCTQAIEEQLVRDGVLGNPDERKAYLARADKLREEIGPANTLTAKPVKGGRRSS
jgi:hypothetical protein